MEKPRGYDDTMPKKKRMNRYMVFVNNMLYGETTAVSPEKAINNVRYQIYEDSSGWWEVPSMEAFDCIEV